MSGVSRRLSASHLDLPESVQVVHRDSSIGRCGCDDDNLDQTVKLSNDSPKLDLDYENDDVFFPFDALKVTNFDPATTSDSRSTRSRMTDP